jgi:hypothetical protein
MVAVTDALDPIRCIAVSQVMLKMVVLPLH